MTEKQEMDSRIEEIKWDDKSEFDREISMHIKLKYGNTNTFFIRGMSGN